MLQFIVRATVIIVAFGVMVFLGYEFRMAISPPASDVRGAELQVVCRKCDHVEVAKVTQIRATFCTKCGNPVLWGSQHFPELLGLAGDVGGKALFHRHAGAICYVDVETASINVDVDTPDALQELGIRGDREPRE